MMALTHSFFPPGRSNETPSIAKFLFLNLLYAFTTLGFSRRQGPHQLAQKSTKTYLPLNELNLTSLPFTSGKTISGACLPFNPVVLFSSASNDLFTAATPVCSGNLAATSSTILLTSSLFIA